MARLNFTIQGLSECAAIAAEARDQVLFALAQHGLEQALFDPKLQIFSVEIDPALHSFSDVRRAIAALGEDKGRVYLAVIMSP
jgi:hypothetical protein